MIADADVLRYIWPVRTSCPECGARKYAQAGRMGRIQYRRCCACQLTYKAIANAAHIDRGGDQSEVIKL